MTSDRRKWFHGCTRMKSRQGRVAASNPPTAFLMLLIMVLLAVLLVVSAYSLQGMRARNVEASSRLSSSVEQLALNLAMAEDGGSGETVSVLMEELSETKPAESFSLVCNAVTQRKEVIDMKLTKVEETMEVVEDRMETAAARGVDVEALENKVEVTRGHATQARLAFSDMFTEYCENALTERVDVNHLRGQFTRADGLLTITRSSADEVLSDYLQLIRKGNPVTTFWK